MPKNSPRIWWDDAMMTGMQRVITLDMEGVVTPEIWIAVADHTGVDALRRTTRDEPNYQSLMDYRIGVLDEHDIALSTIQSVIGTLGLLDGAREFLDELRSRHQVVLLSDTFEQFADSSLTLSLRAYLPDLENRMGTITELHTEINKRFAAAGIEIAFPQQDLHIRSGWDNTRGAASDSAEDGKRDAASGRPLTKG